MTISKKDWDNYINKMSLLSKTAADKMREYVKKNGLSNTDELIRYAYGLATKYGEGSASLACDMCDAIAELAGVAVDYAIPAETATLEEVQKAVYGSLLQSETGQKLAEVVDRLVKQAGADTVQQTAARNGAQFAWIPAGDTCAFCITLASRGWQYISKRSMRKGHAEHIHGNCNCQYMIRYNEDTDVDGYDPEAYRELYYEQSGKPKDKINAIRRMQYAENKEYINAQKRAAYAVRMGNEEA